LAWPYWPFCPLIELIWMMRPHLRARMPSITGRVTLKQESRLVQITSRHCSGDILWKVVSRVMPALLTRISTGPSWRSTSRTIASASCGEETSPLASATVMPSAAICDCQARAFSSLR
jgi:hypothetical protein